MTLIDRSIRERIVIVGVVSWPRSLDEVEIGLDELSLLIDTAGADVVGRVVQRREHPDPATYLGRGKAVELAQLCEAVDADTVVFDDELSPAQQRNLEKVLGRTAIDRTAVILDIFAQNARSEAGKLQVELAMLQYRLPRLRGRGTSLSQQAGRIGTRGPGESQLESDRRQLARRITKLTAQLEALGATRKTQLRARRRGLHRGISLVGYTNAGKSSLLNALTAAGVLVEDRLFATLDPRTRRLQLPGGESVTCSDTVGFIRRLPHQLVSAFHSTLEVVAEADLLVHVVDAAAPDPEHRVDVVRSVLAEIGAGDVPELLAVNKADLAPEPAGRIRQRYPSSVIVSARTGAGLDGLLDEIGSELRRDDALMELAVPFDRGDLLAALHREGEVLEERPLEDRMWVTVRLEPATKERYEALRLPRTAT